MTAAENIPAEPLTFEWWVCWYAVCAHYHSGQGSRGYRILSFIDRTMRPHRVLDMVEDALRDEESNLIIAETYWHLATLYGDKL